MVTNPASPTKTRNHPCGGFLFIQAAGNKPSVWYRRSQARYSVASLLTSTHEVRCISSARRAGYHHAQACIPLRLDDIQHFVLMISNFCEIDDIHAVGVIESLRHYSISAFHRTIAQVSVQILPRLSCLVKTQKIEVSVLN